MDMLMTDPPAMVLLVSNTLCQAWANFLKLYAALGMSIFLARLTGFPWSMLSALASSSSCWSTRSAILRQWAALASWLSDDQAGYADTADFTAASTSSAVELGRTANTSPVAGLILNHEWVKHKYIDMNQQPVDCVILGDVLTLNKVTSNEVLDDNHHDDVVTMIQISWSVHNNSSCLAGLGDDGHIEKLVSCYTENHLCFSFS